ncbi:MAG: hypothetical protein LBN98_01175 [Prevotellaceae bacterium]|jgi:outer membrane protein OmpA-like peptidoglycan-associated protein|nr:hypothetical protein [Prevotellaceae bacterium]
MRQSNEKKRDFFWLSYSDLMTSLFFVMFVLFILVFSTQNNLIKEIEELKKINDTLSISKERLKKIEEIEKTVNNIDKKYFHYDAINKKHILNISFLFPKGKHDITKIIPNKQADLLKAGKAIKELILKYPEEKNIKYLIVVEGQASNDGWRGNDDLSYHRAQSLVNFWKVNKIGLDKLKNCEIIIAGSGVKGIPRDKPDRPPANQRFLITIIPKIGE